MGAEVTPSGTNFRVWAPGHSRVDVVLEATQRIIGMEEGADGYFEVHAPDVGPGTRYKLRLDGGDSFPDPATRFQPEGVHGPSEVVDTRAFSWNDSEWPGISIRGQVLYEMHIGTFTKEGTWAAATADLPRLAELGITVIEVMPIAAFPGRFGWGYDGVCWFAPTAQYGSPHDLQAFVDRAHSLAMGVILDVVYNHLGPDGNYLRKYSEHYLADRATEWGDAMNFDGEHSEHVRDFVIENARFWIEDYHFDGLRIDATQQILDSSPTHILEEMTTAVRLAASPRHAIVIGENEPNDAKLLRSADRGGYGLDALWNDDFHHAACVALTGHNEAYYSGFFGNPQEFISAVKYNSLYQGQLYYWQKQGRGTPGLELPPTAGVTFLENHDQVANNPRSARVRTLSNPSLYRAMTALTLLAPGTPMIFQGQEFGATTPFFYFADHENEVAGMVLEGRRDFLKQFPRIAGQEPRKQLADPSAFATFERSKLRREETDPEFVALHRDLIALRRDDPAFQIQRKGAVDGAVLSAHSFVLRFFAGDSEDRLLLLNLGRDLLLQSPPEPLLASPNRTGWTEIWSSEQLKYGGTGTPALDTPDGWRLPAFCAVVLRPKQKDA